jgi:hypothetical protein
MADLTENLDGNLTLSETESRCEVEQNGGFQLERITNGVINAGGTAVQVNVAEFVSKPIGGFTDLSFVEVGNQDAAALKAQNEGAGFTFICDEKIYVQDQITRVLVFGK